MRLPALVLGTCLVAACSEGATAVVEVPALPPQMRLEAHASGMSDGHEITCELDFVVNMTRDGDGYTGEFGGEIHRISLDATQAGIEFWGQAHTEARIRFGDGGRVSLVSYRGGAPMPVVTDSRFWEGIRRFDGVVLSGVAVAGGTWQCAPMDARGDTFGTLTGTWHLIPMP